MRRILVLAALAFVLIPASSASAGRLFVTGHDPDWHCALTNKQCHFLTNAIDFARGGSADPSKPLLLLDRNIQGECRLCDALFNSTNYGGDSDLVYWPRNADFRSLPLSASNFSAIIIASDYTTCPVGAPCEGGFEGDLNERNSTPDSNAINARKSDFVKFFNDGGGIVALSGAAHGDGDPSNGEDPYYGLLPLPLGGAAAAAPFCLTLTGALIGMEDGVGPVSCPDSFYWYAPGGNDDINCCETHNTFFPVPDESGLLTAETDVGTDGLVAEDDFPTTLVAEGTIVGGDFSAPFDKLPPPALNKTVNAVPTKGTVRYQLPKTRKSKGEGFQPLRKPRVFPVGTLFDARKGTVKVASSGKGGQRQVAEFSAGLFQALQNRKTKGLTEARLKGGNFSRKRCTTSKRKRRRSRRSSNGEPTADASRRRRLRKRTVRKLRFKGSGRYRARARGSAGTVRGTVFSVTDRCDGTLWKVKRGRVLVRHGRKKVLVKRGRSYLAKRR